MTQDKVLPQRKDYMAKIVTHEQYYESVAREAGIDWTIHPLLDRVKAALQRGDEHLNSIPLMLWDALGAELVLKGNISHALKAHGDFWSMAGSVCVLKAAAKVAAKKGGKSDG